MNEEKTSFIEYIWSLDFSTDRSQIWILDWELVKDATASEFSIPINFLISTATKFDENLSQVLKVPYKWFFLEIENSETVAPFKTLNQSHNQIWERSVEKSSG